MAKARHKIFFGDMRPSSVLTYWQIGPYRLNIDLADIKSHDTYTTSLSFVGEDARLCMMNPFCKLNHVTVLTRP